MSSTPLLLGSCEPPVRPTVTSGCAPLPSASFFIKDVPRGDCSRVTPVRHRMHGVSDRTLTPCISDDALKGMETAIRDHRLRARLDAEMDTTRYPSHRSRNLPPNQTRMY